METSKAYEAPELVEFGDVNELTQYGTVSNDDNDAGSIVT
ncbi:MAG TPA: lasso RiPP family leader peptide-containing protein [Anaerolineaceae bacterium]|nr:lasso RiPP family leader peptide-containing protein [Anaerolineaceae bacterium]HPN53472.1 lasso RiPP family leader peptide-containing protein [Anaerolineaceae bacterium]